MKKNLALCLLVSCLCIKKNYAQFVALQDSLALVDLYDSTDGPNWFNNNNWKTAAPVSMWTGVGVYNNRVSSLSFTGNRMKGKIPASFKNLTKLERLYLLDNGLKANLGEFADSLTSLVYFYVGEYYFTNTIPESVSMMLNLQEFTLYGSYGLEYIPSSFKTLNNLTAIDIGYNGITGDISNSIPPNVIGLNIEFNKLNFDPIEKLVKRFGNNTSQFNYREQANISTQTDADKVWVSAGGTVSNNTYKWYKVGSGAIDSTRGDSAYYPSSPGSYYAEVSNSIATHLILTSNAVKAQGIRASICSGTTNATFTSDISGANYQWQKSIDSLNYINISNNADYSGVNSKTLNISTLQVGNYGTRYRCVVDGNMSTSITITFQNRWTGGIDANWENNANWSCGSLPDENTDVVIESGSVVVNSNVTVKSIRLLPGAFVSVNSGYTLTVKSK